MARADAEMTAGISFEAHGADEVIQQAKKISRSIEQQTQIVQAAIRAVESQMKAISRMAGSEEEARAQVEAATASIEAKKDSLATLVAEMKKAQAASNLSKEEALDFGRQIRSARAEIKAEEEAIRPLVGALGQLAKAQDNVSRQTRKLQRMEGESGKVYGANVWEVRSYSRGVAELLNIFSGGIVTLADWESVMGAAVFTTSEWTLQMAQAVKHSGGWAEALEGLKAKIIGVDGVTAGLIVAVGLATFWLRKQAKERKQQEKAVKELTAILRGETDEIERNTEAWVRNQFIERRVLDDFDDLGITTQRYTQIIKEAGTALADLGTEGTSFESVLRRIKDAQGALAVEVLRGGGGLDELGRAFKHLNEDIKNYASSVDNADVANRDAFISNLNEIIPQIHNLSDAVRGAASSNNIFLDSVWKVMDADISQQNMALRAVRLIQDRIEAEEDLALARRNGTRDERLDLERQLQDLDVQIQGVFQDAIKEGVNLPELIREEMRKAQAAGHTITATEIMAILPEVNDLNYSAAVFARQVSSAVQDRLATEVTDLANSVGVPWEQVGQEIRDGIVSGADGLEPRLFGALNGAINSVRERIRQITLDSDSPSKVWAKLVGLPIGEGITEGALEGLKDLFPMLDNALSAVRAVISFQQSKISIVRAEDRLADAKQELKDLKQLRNELGADTMQAQDRVAIRDAERRLALTRAAQRAGIADRSDVILAEQNLANARRDAMTYGEAVDDMKLKVQEAQLAVLSAQLSMVAAFASMMDAAGGMTEESIQAFRAFAIALGVPKKQVKDLVRLMRQAATVADSVSGGGPSGGGGGPTYSTPYQTLRTDDPNLVFPSSGYRFFHRGGHFMGNTNAIVGERGPELVRFKQPGEVVPNHRLRSMRGGGHGGSVFITMPVQWPIDSIERRKIIRMIREELRRMDKEQ